MHGETVKFTALKYRPTTPFYCMSKTIFYSISQENGLEDT
jgi:hypothetical protein